MKDKTNVQPADIRQGGAIGGWLCFGLGIMFMYFSVWLFFIYGPLFIAALILSIVALAQRRLGSGLALLLSTLICVPALWLYLSLDRTSKALDKLNAKTGNQIFDPSLAPNRKHLTSNPERAVSTSKPASVSDTDSIRINSDKAIFKAPESIVAVGPERIVVASAREIEPSSIRVGPFSFSRNGDRLAYVKSEGFGAGESGRIVIRDVDTLTTIDEFPIDVRSSSARLVWSPDGARILYASMGSGSKSGNYVGIIDLKIKAITQLPFPNADARAFTNFGSHGGQVIWHDAESVYIIPGWGIESSKKFSIDSLETQAVFSDADRAIKIAARTAEGKEFELKKERRLREFRYRLLSPISPVDQRWFLERKKVLDSPECLVVSYNTSSGRAERDKSLPQSSDLGFRSALLRLKSSSILAISPTHRHVVHGSQQSVKLHYIGVRDAPNLKFGLEFSHDRLAKDLERKRLASILGSVYSPQQNPLNGKVIGPDRERFKGYVLVVQDPKQKWHFTTAYEYSGHPEEGDIVADFRQLQGRGEFGDYWGIVTRSGLDVGGATKEEAQQNSDGRSPASSREDGNLQTQSDKTRPLLVCHLMKPVGGNQTRIEVDGEAVLTIMEFKDAALVSRIGEGARALSVALQDKDAKELAIVTRENAGKLLGIFHEEELILLANLKGEKADGKLLFDDPDRWEGVEKLLERISGDGHEDELSKEPLPRRSEDSDQSIGSQVPRPSGTRLWIFEDSSKRYLTATEVRHLSKEELWRARNEIFVRRGYVFQSERGREFAKRFGASYRPRLKTQDAVFETMTEVERANIELIKKNE